MSAEAERVEALAALLTLVMSRPAASGTTYVAHAQVRVALANHLATSPELAAYVAQQVAEARKTALVEAADELDRRASGGTAFNAAAKVIRDRAEAGEA